ncbi:MAG TPA: hypothetical protein VK053_04340 [Jiangellaceae bacterium]|nr:hypothetical protein [Jiangellaceae bacterium]
MNSEVLEIVFTTALVVTTTAVGVVAGLGVAKLFKGPARAR